MPEKTRKPKKQSQKYIIFNFKQNPKDLKTLNDILVGYSKIFTAKFFKQVDSIKMMISLPTVFLQAGINFKKNIFTIGSQDISLFEEGAHTGENSASQIKSIGASFSIVGHSEKREQGDTDEIVKQKMELCFKNNLIPVVCFGEKERTGSNYISFLQNSVRFLFSDISPAKFKKVIIAYEPVWSIGEKAKRPATQDECREAIAIIRKTLADLHGAPVAKKVPILYGGSVNDENIKSLLENTGIDGVLIGRMSLLPEKILKFTNEISKIN